MSDNSKYIAVVWMKELLIEERSGIQHSKIGTFLYVDDDLRLEEQGVGVRKNHVVKLLYVDHCSVFPFAFRIMFSNNKDRETEWRVFRRELRTA